MSSAISGPKSSSSPSVSASSSSAREPLAVAPQIAQPRACLRLGVPALAEALAERGAPVGLERPGAQVAGDVEALVDVREPGLGRPADSGRGAEQLGVAGGHSLADPGARAVQLAARRRASPRSGAGARARRRGRGRRPPERRRSRAARRARSGPQSGARAGTRTTRSPSCRPGAGTRTASPRSTCA